MSSDLLRVWHWEVHQQFQEDLYFFHFRVIPFNFDKTYAALRAFFQNESIEGYCFYDIVGGFDILIRVWLTSALSNTFEAKLRYMIPGVRNVFEHKVSGFPLSWKWGGDDKGIDRKALRRLTEDKVRRVQNNRDPVLISTLQNAGLFKEFPKTNKIKFFVNIGIPEAKTDRAKQEMIRIVIETTKEYEDQEALDRSELCITLGEQWGIFSAETNDYFTIGKFVTDLGSKLEAFGSFTTTYLATGNEREERGNISTQALSSSKGKDIAVERLIPELYDPKENISDELRMKIQDWARRNLIMAGVNEEYEKIISNSLLAVARGREKDIRVYLFDFFAQVEGNMRILFPKFVSDLHMKQSTVFDAAGVIGNKDGKFLSLGSLFCLYDACIKLSDKIPEKRLLSGYQKIVELRNKIAHCEEKFEPLVTWEDDLTIVVRFMGNYQRLCDLIGNQASTHGKHT